MHTDKFLKIGSGHKICQDYVIAGNDYVILSDGCSMAPDTDIGARILAKCAEANVKLNLIDTNFIHQSIYYSQGLGLSLDCLCATTLILKANENNVHFFCVGDGSLIYKKDGKINFKRWEYPSGAPYYLRYELNHKQNYIEQFGDLLFEYSDGDVKESHGNFIIDGCIENPEWVLIASDGLSSFQETITTDTTIAQNMVSWQAIMQELIAFKNLNGEFLQKRCNRAMKDFKNKNWSNFDDVSIAGIVM